MYDAGDVASLLTHKGSFTLHLTDLFAKGAQCRFLAVDKLFFPPLWTACAACCADVSPTNTTHVTAHTLPYGGPPGCAPGARHTMHPPHDAPATRCTRHTMHPPHDAPATRCTRHTMHPPHDAPATRCTRHTMHPPHDAPATRCTRHTMHPPHDASATRCTRHTMHPPHDAPATRCTRHTMHPPHDAPATRSTRHTMHPPHDAPATRCTRHTMHPPHEAPATRCTRHTMHPPHDAPATRCTRHTMHPAGTLGNPNHQPLSGWSLGASAILRGQARGEGQGGRGSRVPACQSSPVSSRAVPLASLLRSATTSGCRRWWGTCSRC